VAKGTKFNSIGRAKQTVVHGGGRGKRPEIPVNKTESNVAADKQSMMLFSGLACGSVLLFLFAIVWAGASIVAGVTAHPPNWLSIVLAGVTIGASIFIARMLAWMSFFGAIMFAFKMGAWQTQERLCRMASNWWKLFPGGGCTAATLLVQSLVNRGQYEEAIEFGRQQYEVHASDAKAAQNLAGMYVTIGMASQLQGNSKESIVWNERAITALNASVEEMANKKTIFSKIASGQAKEMAGTMLTQLAMVTFNNASCYMSLQNQRQAKAQFKKAIELANQAPDFSEKKELIRQCGDALGRLKHV
jgi:tetratricopeptide (TPR) repeat protein